MSLMDTGNIERTRVRKLALLGFDGSAMASLELFLSRERGLMVVSPEKADLLIVNGDQGKSSEALQADYTKQYNLPGVLISFRDLEWPGFALVKKPYSSAQLLEAIRSLFLLGVERGAAATDEASVAAVMTLKGDGVDHRIQAYDDYRSRKDAGLSLMTSLQNEKQQEAQKQALLKEKLRRGREATKRAAEHAEHRAQMHADSASRAPAAGSIQPPSAVSASPVATPSVAVASKASVAEEEVKAALARASQAQSAARQRAKVEAERQQSERALQEQKRKEAERTREVEQARQKVLAEQQALAKRKAAEQALAKKRAAIKQAQLKAAQAAEAGATQVVQTAATADKVAGLELLPEKRSTRARPPAVGQPQSTAIKAGQPAKSGYPDDEMVYRCCGNLSDVDISRPDERRRIYFNTDGALLYWLPMAVKKAKLSNIPIEIGGLPRSFVYLPADDDFFGDFGEELLLQYALSRFGFGELDLKERPELTVSAPKSSQERSIREDRDAMIWKVALWTARGRLNQGMDPEKRYRLKARPDFGRLIETPHANEITELWYDRRLSALDVVRILNLPQRYVFAYMSGVYALGWLQE